MARAHASLFMRQWALVTLILLINVNNSARAARQPSAAADPRSCSAAEQEPTYDYEGYEKYEHYDEYYEPLEPMQRPAASQAVASPPTAVAPAPPVTLQDQMRAQQLLLHVLSNVTSGVITAEAALELLRGVTALRSSLVNGAAADRWAKMKANSLTRRQERQKQQQVQQNGNIQHRQQQQQREARPSSPPPGAAAALAPNRGILIVAGRSHQFLNAYVLLQLLRSPTIACKLPAEVVYYGPNEFDARVTTAILKHAAATATSVNIIDGKDFAPPMDLEPHKVVTHMTGFKSKVHAITFVTSFDEVLLLDSDNTPMADPTYLFDSQSFKSHGNIMWLDFWTNQWMKPVVYSVLGLDVPWEVDPGFRASEAGQLVINRLQHYDVLEWLWLLNTHSASGVNAHDPGVVGKCLWGDKDTYPLAFHLAGKARLINNIPHHPLQALSRPMKSKFVHAGMAQRGLYGELLFLHRTAAGKLWPHCAMNGGKTCKIAGMTTPVDQQQLVASVKDVTAMEQGVEMVDLEWQEKHCGPGVLSAEAAAGVAAAAPKQQQQQQPSGSAGAVTGNGAREGVPKVHMATMVACDLKRSVGLLPIPVIGVKKLPDQVQKMLRATFEAFLQTAELTRNDSDY